MIAEQFMHDVAQYVEGRVSKVVLNSSYVISQFEQKAVTDGMLAINYIIPASDVSLVTKIELKDAADHVITSHDVNVPITSDTLMLQTIHVKEVTN
jgi:hypothetical protein